MIDLSKLLPEQVQIINSPIRRSSCTVLRSTSCNEAYHLSFTRCGVRILRIWNMAISLDVLNVLLIQVGVNFMAQAIFAAAGESKKHQLAEYMMMAMAKQLNINDWYRGDSTVGWATQFGLCSILRTLLNEGCSLKRENRAVRTTITTSKHGALKLILSIREDDSRNLELQCQVSNRYCSITV